MPLGVSSGHGIPGYLKCQRQWGGVLNFRFNKFVGFVGPLEAGVMVALLEGEATSGSFLRLGDK